MTDELKPIPPMPEVEESEAEGNLVLQMYCTALENWGQECADIAQQQTDRVEELEQVIAAIEPGEENQLTVARRLKRERVELGLAINRLAQALGWPSVAPDRPFSEQIVDAALGQIASSKALADELAEALKDAFSWLEAQPLMDRMIEMGSPEVTKLFHDCPAAVAKHTAARQMNKEARNEGR